MRHLWQCLQRPRRCAIRAPAPDNCSPGSTDCNGACVDLNTNFNNCGSCGNTCNDASICTADSCTDGVCDNQSGAQACNDNDQCTQDMCDPVTGCFSQELTSAQIEGLCLLLLQQQDPTVSTATHCIHCETGGLQCNATILDDGIACTDDACPASAVYPPGDVNVENDTNCPTQCAAECDKTTHVMTPAMTDNSGCLLDSDPNVCTRTCASTCNPDFVDSGNQRLDTNTGCVEDDSTCVPVGCLTECESDPMVMASTLTADGCIRDNNVCQGLTMVGANGSCYDGTCDPDFVATTEMEANPGTGCIENDTKCPNAAGWDCEPDIATMDIPMSLIARGCCIPSGSATNCQGENIRCCSGLCSGNVCL